jgi:glycerol-3-phosphate dehydrogenase subunit B
VKPETISCDLIIIGTGMAGMAAAVFAARRGLDAVQVGITGELGFASGPLDLLGVHPVAEGRVVDDPWQGIVQLCRDEPLHPYAKLEIAAIRRAMDDFLAFLEAGGYPHVTLGQRNQTLATAAGTRKPTFAVPHTMQHGPTAMTRRAPCLLVGFEGLKGFSARQIALSLEADWPDLRPVRMAFPDAQGELYTEHMARALDAAETREKLVAAIRPHLGDAHYVGLPAVLGLYRTGRVLADLQQGLGVPVFEIPTMLPAVTGVRLRELCEQRLPALGIRPLWQQRVLGVQRLNDGRWSLAVGYAEAERQVVARSVLLCSGRFFGKGLHARRQAIQETIFNLPVVQPMDRKSWHHKDLLDPQGHAINRAGVAVDEGFRPVDNQCDTLYPNLFAAGSLLAYQDWMRQKCGSGLAVATAYAAVESCAGFLKQASPA